MGKVLCLWPPLRVIKVVYGMLLNWNTDFKGSCDCDVRNDSTTELMLTLNPRAFTLLIVEFIFQAQVLFSKSSLGCNL